MTDGAETLGQFFAHVDPEPEGVLTKIKLLFPDTFAQMEREGVLQYLDDPDKLRAYIGEFIKTHREAQLPEQVEPRASEISPGEVTRRVETYQNAVKEANRTLQNRQGQLRNLQKKYIGQLTDNFIRQTRAYYQRESEEVAKVAAKKIDEAERLAKDVTSRTESINVDEYVRRIEETLPDYPEKASIRARAEEAATESRNQYKQAAQTYIKTRSSVTEAKKRLFASENPTTKPDVLLSRAIELSESDDYSTLDIAQMAELQARAVEFQETGISGVTMGGHGFFQTIADPKNAKEINLAPLADRVFDALRPEQKVAIIQDVIERSLERFEGAEAKTTEDVGGRVALSNTVRQSVRAGDIKSGITTAARVGEVNGRLFGAFGGVNPQIIQAVGQSKTIEWLNTQSFYAFLVVEKLKTALGSGGKFVLKEGAEVLAKKIGGKGVGGAIGATIASALPFLPPGIAQAVGYVAGEVVLGKIVEWGGKALSAIGYVVSGGVLTSILEGKPASLADTFVFFPLVVIILIPMLFIFPWFLNLQQFPDDVRRTALVTSIGGGEGPGGTPTDCNATPDAPVCSFEECVGDCRWPTSGTITQGPKPSCGSHSGGEDENGIDIAGGGEPTVYAMLDGVVEKVNNNCDDYTGTTDERDPAHNCGDGYGNFVIVVGKASNGKTYKLIFGHMLRNIPVSEGDPVAARTPVGKMDHTGYSSGAHLHFGVLGNGNVLDLVPDNYPGVNKAQVDECNGSCGKPCPSAPVSSD